MRGHGEVAVGDVDPLAEEDGILTPSFDWKRPCFGRFPFKNRGHWGSRSSLSKLHGLVETSLYQNVTPEIGLKIWVLAMQEFARLGGQACRNRRFFCWGSPAEERC